MNLREMEGWCVCFILSSVAVTSANNARKKEYWFVFWGLQNSYNTNVVGCKEIFSHWLLPLVD